MFNKIKEKIKFLRWAYEHRNCTSKANVICDIEVQGCNMNMETAKPLNAV